MWRSGYLDWPDVRQMFRLKRIQTFKRRKTVEIA